MTDPVLAQIEDLLLTEGRRRYGLENVSQLQHALQSALIAEQQHETPAFIAAALLHDIGHMTHTLGENPAVSGNDDRHEEHGHDFLVRHFGPDVTEPVRLHVAAKRYLCATDPTYFDRLAPDSVLSLKLQGGPMSPQEVAEFQSLPHAEAAVRLRRIDETAKVQDLPTPPVSHFMLYVASSLAA